MKEDANRGAKFREARSPKNPDRNPDPITKEPGSHPVGTGVGAAAGGAAGLAAGAAAGAASGAAIGGPVGAGIGIVAGAIAGGLGGKGAAEAINPTATAGTDSSWRAYVGYSVYDQEGFRIGHLAGAWGDRGAQPQFLGVRTGWIFGPTHVVPGEGAEVDRRARAIRVPYSESQVRTAPDCEPSRAVSGECGDAVARHYSIRSQRTQRRSVSQDIGEGQVTIPLAEERVVVGKREVESGGIRLRKVIRTEIVHQPIELRREEIIIERVPGPENAGSAQSAFTEEMIFIPLREEQAIIGKEAHVREEIRIRKKALTEQQELHEAVRKEDIELVEPQAQQDGARQDAARAGKPS